MSEIPFPNGAQDGDIFFHLDKVCLYHEDSDTWECRNRTNLEDPEPPATIYTTDVYVPEGFREMWQTKANAKSIPYTVPALQTDYDLNKAMIDFVALVTDMDQSTIDTSQFITGTVLEARLSGIASANDFSALAALTTAAINQQAQTQANHETAVDAKFDQLRAAVSEATDFATLKARLLAVLT